MASTRRAWLASAGASVWWAAWSPTHAAIKPRRIPFGFSLYGMKTLPLNRALKICADIGYSGVELPAMPDWPAAPESLNGAQRGELRRMMDDLAIDLLGVMENLPVLAGNADSAQQLDRLRRAMELSCDLRPDRPPVVETILGGDPNQWERNRALLVDRLGAWSDEAAQMKTVIAIKPHVSNSLRTPEHTEAVLRRVNSPWIRLAYDFSHFQRQNFPLAESVELLAPWISFVHIKDNRPVGGKVEFALPGEGEPPVDYFRMLESLKQADYAGPVVVEVSAQVSGKPGYDPIVAAERCYLNVEPAFVKAGLRARG